jgi:hypothetical protein
MSRIARTVIATFAAIAGLAGPAMAQDYEISGGGYHQRYDRQPVSSRDEGSREQFRAEVAFWNDRADLARLYDMQVTLRYNWRFGDFAALQRLDQRAVEYLNNEVEEARREVGRSQQFGVGYNGRPYAYGNRHNRGNDRLSIVVAMRDDYRRLAGRQDAQSLTAKQQILARLAGMQQQEVRADREALRSFSWSDPLQGIW